MDDRAVLAALARLGPAAEPRQKAAAKLTAEAIQRSAQSRVSAMTHGTGFTAKNIVVRPSTTVNGYVVTMGDVVSEEETARRKSLGMKSAKSGYHQEKHTGLWLEFGTIQGRPGSHTSAPRAFLFPASELERVPHARRVRNAIAEAQADVGLGG